ncbi:hypothetical protein JNB_12039 [Janibacter sp. HTCC2649]|uniref:SRPBCC family protein n=1 Tax=Janibacter sp. HTCC2649 TaxID=313589 RepID=UPI000067087D|nr:SRPBCC family protein [Janibacter sp. HTCC2649]EAQ00905.1 hypothetical protein JNB_12039 [Janibacter sp. HTCC2649]
MENETRVVSSTRDIAAPAEAVFELIADPRRQPEWDGNDNLVEIIKGDRIRGVGEIFAMRTTKGNHRDNLVVDFEEGRRIAWRPGNEGEAPAGHEWRWEVEPLEDGTSRVTHTYDWTGLTDEARMPRARATQEPQLRASLDRLATLAESLTA